MSSHSLIYLVLAAFGLGILVFIHELGHYVVARRKKMTVEVFSIGFGKPFFTWTFQGVKWQLCYLLFGGYVKIAGMEKKGSLEPYQIAGGFYSKKPIERIQVALAGPIVNIVFGFLIFCLLFALGGRIKSFAEYTHLIGWVDPHSKIYEAQVRPGDLITEMNHRPFKGFNDFIYASLLDAGQVEIGGFKNNYWQQSKEAFTYTLEDGGSAKGMERAVATRNLIAPADYLLYAQTVRGASAEDNGVEKGDRLVWVDGQLIFSKRQLISVVNDGKALLTVERGGEVFLSRIPRLKISDLKLSSSQKGELADLLHDSGLKGKLADLYFVPYFLSAEGVVEKTLSYFNDVAQEQIFEEMPRASIAKPLSMGDKIIAVDGASVDSAHAIFNRLQTKAVQLIVKREPNLKPISWKKADSAFQEGLDVTTLSQIAQTIGTAHPLKVAGDFKLIGPITPKPLSEFPLPQEMREQRESQLEMQKKMAAEITDVQERQEALKAIEEGQKRLMLGIVFQDLSISYNPSPWTLFTGVIGEVTKTLKALVTGYLSPKWLAGPVGIVQVMHHNWMAGFKEALFWMGVISINLGILNLLPIPVLDGGHICFALWEKITKKRISSKTMERLIFPFVVLLIVFFVYVTYHDIARLVGRFFH